MYKLKDLFRDKKVNKIFIIIGIGTFLLALLDILFLRSGLFGNYITFTLGLFSNAVWILYRDIAFILIFAFSFSYWFYKRDKSEAFSVGIGILILWFFGIEDILYFWLQETGVPQFLPWLNNSLVVGNLSHIIGFTDVTNISLYLIAIVGLILTFITTKILVRKF